MYHLSMICQKYVTKYNSAHTFLNPVCVLFFIDVQLIRSKFGDILQCLPLDYEKTLQVIQDYLTDEHICIVLSNSDHSSANRAILDCLLEKANHSRGLLQFCDQLEKILSLSSNQGQLANIITGIRTSACTIALCYVWLGIRSYLSSIYPIFSQNYIA